jgi:hypothetical protein
LRYIFQRQFRNWGQLSFSQQLLHFSQPECHTSFHRQLQNCRPQHWTKFNFLVHNSNSTQFLTWQLFRHVQHQIVHTTFKCRQLSTCATFDIQLSTCTAFRVTY